ARRQVGPQRRVVEQLAVVDHLDTLVLVADGLAAVLQADDAQAAVGQGQAGAIQEAVLVGAAVHDGPRHGFDGAGRHGSPAAQVNHSCDATHPERPLWSVVRRPWSVASTLLPSSYPARRLDPPGNGRRTTDDGPTTLYWRRTTCAPFARSTSRRSAGK